MRAYIYSLMTDRRKDVPSDFVKGVLCLASLAYGAAVKIILFAYRYKIFQRYRLSKPVMSIGNITWGGSGKTPLVQFIAKFLKENRLKPAVLLRGYMGETRRSTTDSDEARLLRESLPDVPVGVGANRFRAAREILAQDSVDIFLLDDGFQHWPLERELDIVAIDAANPFGNGRLLPRGILREPLQSLRRAQVLVLTKTNFPSLNLDSLRTNLRSLNPDALILETIHRPVVLRDLKNPQGQRDLIGIREKRICALCGIADPQSFEKILVSLGAVVVQNFIFDDHHQYTPQEIQNIVEFCRRNNVAVVVTTDKDAVKLKPFLSLWEEGEQILSLEIVLDIVQGKEEFLQAILKVAHP